MCGIAGILTRVPSDDLRFRLQAMTNVVAHRGPDGEGFWYSEDRTVHFGHRRLKIEDPTPAAAQPMHYKDQYVVIFNGEIYNFRSLRKTLEARGHRFRTASDTEVLLACYDEWGTDMCQHLDGMFAFALHDRRARTVTLARDRFGEKPLFYSYHPRGELLFGSEMKCLWAGGVPKACDGAMLHRYLTDGLVSNPTDPAQTFFLDCHRLLHGHTLTVDLTDFSIKINKYFDLNPAEVNHDLSEDEAIGTFRSLLEASVRDRLQTPLRAGSSLSGGLDSSSIVSLASKINPLHQTLSVVFPGLPIDESGFADKVVRHCGVASHYLTPTAAELVDEFGAMMHFQEEPVGGPSIFLQYKVMQLAAQLGIDIMLDGDGADETLAGYVSYHKNYLLELRATDPVLFRQEWRAYQELQAQLPQHAANRIRMARLKLHLNHQLARSRQWRANAKAVFRPLFAADFAKAHHAPSPLSGYSAAHLNDALYSSTMQLGLQNELRYSDRNSMAHGREVRLPYLSHQLVSFAFSLPARYKIKEGYSKWILRKAVEPHLPADITWRRCKIGYAAPNQLWMQHPAFLEGANDMLHRLHKAGILSDTIRKSGVQGWYDQFYDIKWRLFALSGVIP